MLPAVPLAGGIAFLFQSAFAGVVGVFAAAFTKKTAIALALGSFLIAGWVALQLSVAAAWVALQWSVPSGMIIPLGFLASLLPTNFGACMGAIILTKIGRWLWDGQADLARAVAMS